MNSFDCNSVLELLSEYIDDEVRDELCQAIRDHLSRCPDCRIYVDEVTKTIRLYQAPDARADVPMRATAMLNAALTREYAVRTGERTG